VRLQPLGKSGLIVSRLGLGCNNFGRRLDSEGARAVVDAALDCGVTFFDTAETYGEGDSERFLGSALVGRRDEVVLATKFGGGQPDGTPRGARESVRRSTEASLERLQTDRVDLLYYHVPDGVTPIAETLGAMQELIDEGKAVALGCSNFSAGQLREADTVAGDKSRCEAVQNQYSLLERDAEEDVLPLCVELEVGFVAYFPLASGFLTGKYTRGEPAPAGTRLSDWGGDLLNDESFDQVDQLAAVAADRGLSLLELALSAVASMPGVASVLTGAMSPDQVRANAAAAQLDLEPHDRAAVPLIEGHGVHAGPRRR
jgi:aryl-alcohol dehydrogenase-like predicted oxidoreductase